MAWLSRFCNRVTQIARPRRSKALPGIHSVAQFYTILERERARADRNGHQFSMVVFDTGDAQADSTQVQHLVRVVVKRIRLTDQAGWFDSHRIGVVLPETSMVGAWAFADDVCQTIAAKASLPKCTFYTYPSSWSNKWDGHSVQLSFADICPKWQIGMSRELFAFAKHSRSELSPSAGERLTPDRAQQSKEPVETLEEAVFFHRLPIWKRAMDIAGAVVALILFSPIMLIVAIAIKVTSKGPVFFKQQRAGLGRKPFTFYKFRSMSVDAEDRKKELLKHNERTGPAFKMTDDPRVTPVGDFIRKWSLDELPQLFNVLRGDLSLVGPRPLPIEEASQHDHWQDKRLCITPGITCLWQVYARHDKCFDRWTRLDIEYISRQSPLLDIKILLRTLPAVLSRKGAC